MKRDLIKTEYSLTVRDNEIITSLALNAFEKYQDVNNSEFLSNYYEYSEKMPFELRNFIKIGKSKPYDYFLINNLDYDVSRLQPTPTHWNRQKSEYTRFIQFKHFIVAANLGYPYGWKTQQNGSFVSDVLPIPGYESYQQGFGSIGGLKFHTEDPFHIARADFFTLMCMRNPKNIPTTLFPLDLKKIPEKTKNELFKEQYDIIPDESHTDLTYTDNIHEKKKKIFEDFNKVRKISILYGNKNNPYLRIDPEIMSTDALNEEALKAYNFICKEIEASRTELVLEPGQIFVINNHRLAHGRGSFKASYDGNDRWLERILTLEDVRKTICYRNSETEHVMVR